MKVAYFDCFSGISGDMILGALVDLGVDVDYLKGELMKLDVGGYEISWEKVEKAHVFGTKVDVAVREKHAHRGLSDVNKLIDESRLDADVKVSAKKIFLRLAEAEGRVHNIDADKVHFHEVGAIDSIIDIVGAVVGIRKLGIGRIYCSSLNVGSGSVKCAHGVMPVPAPATAELIKGVPVYSSGVVGELVTPTGAAVITTLADCFGGMPKMRVDKVGYGAGDADFLHPNMLRVFLGEADGGYDADVTDVIETNIDDMSPEYYGHVTERLMTSGALDVFLTNIMMKNNRPAIRLSVISMPESTERLVDIIFSETTTFGVRIYETRRRKLSVEKKDVKTKYGAVSVKVGRANGVVKVVSPEYRDCKKVADEYGVPLRDVYDLVKALARDDIGL
ncbi:MAG: nickel pincer cofactor biosynthesis protein LarC [archaeon]